MAAPKLDPIDRRILAELQADGRMTNVELASRVGISAPPCLRRVRTLEEEGYIRAITPISTPANWALRCGYLLWCGCAARPRWTFRPLSNAAATGPWCASATC